MTRALDSLEVRTARSELPEFDAALQDELRDEGDDLGAFQAFSLLADWVRKRLEISPQDEFAKRAFDVVEQIINDDRFPLGDPLAAEFIEGIWEHPDARALMGPRTLERARPQR